MPLLVLGVLLLTGVLLVGCAASAPKTDALLAAGSNRAFAHTLMTSAPPDRIWHLWTDVAGWPTWDAELEAATLDGSFVSGATGRLKAVGGPPARFRVRSVEPGRSYVFETALPLASLRIRRTWAPGPVPGRTAFTHAVSFHGLLGGLWASRFGPRYRAALPQVMERLRALAETPEEKGDAEVDG